MTRTRRLGLALLTAVVAGLPLVAGPAAAADRVGATEAACPPEGTRFQDSGDPTVYFIGPKGFKYFIPNETVYFNLWGSWQGIQPGPSGCGGEFWGLTNGHLAKTATSDSVFVWDETFAPDCYRRVVDWATFTTKYHFDPAKIQTRDASYISPRVCPEHPWT
ncbi:hypothetical protein [Amycolatopsis sp. NPDC098790]|uniref:hypothetical protein n=1 Tax=Amycolatopsis sp. NPDC098790 TaxID=3363939 RepID=UPI00382633F3